MAVHYCHLSWLSIPVNHYRKRLVQIRFPITNAEDFAFVRAK